MSTSIKPAVPKSRLSTKLSALDSLSPEELLIDCLSDPAPQVRFWAAFALGSMRYRQALPALRKLAGKDRGHFGTWWTVGVEASDAISLLEGRQPPMRNQKHRSA